MIASNQNSRTKSPPYASFIQPYFNTRRPKNVCLHELSLSKNMNGTVRSLCKSKEIVRDQEKKTISMRELSIDQIKTKIKEYLGHTGQTEITNIFSSQLINDSIHRSTHEQFRVSMFKNNAKKRVNLKIMEGLNPERYNSKNKEFSIKEAFINKRTVLNKQNDPDFLGHKNGMKLDFKLQKKKRSKNSYFEPDREVKSTQLKRIDSFRPVTPKGWESSMQPWRKWQQVENVQNDPLY